VGVAASAFGAKPSSNTRPLTCPFERKAGLVAAVRHAPARSLMADHSKGALVRLLRSARMSDRRLHCGVTSDLSPDSPGSPHCSGSIGSGHRSQSALPPFFTGNVGVPMVLKPSTQLDTHELFNQAAPFEGIWRSSTLRRRRNAVAEIHRNGSSDPGLA
jgi:hypothetical protein